MSTWLEITIRLPIFGLIVIFLLLAGIIIFLIYYFIRSRSRLRQLSEEMESLKEKYSELEQQKYNWVLNQDSYRHFLYNISHEVSNPLQSILTNLDLMNSESQDEGRLWKQYHSIIASEIRRLITLTENLRELSRLESPDTPLKRGPVNLKGVIEDIIMAQYEKAKSENIDLYYSGPDRLARVFGNREQLHQAILNLVDNAIKYSNDTGGEICINVLEENEKIICRVIDDGLGISPEDLPHIFETAYRSPEIRKHKQSGSGLGLVIVKRIIERHSGEINIDSEIGKGTTVTFTIPIYIPSE